jgi:hypothetical protein
VEEIPHQAPGTDIILLLKTKQDPPCFDLTIPHASSSWDNYFTISKPCHLVI